MAQKILQNKKNRDLNAGLGIEKEDFKRACANDFVIDCSKRSKFKEEPRFSK